MATYLEMYLNSGEGVLDPQGVHQMIFDRVPDIDGDASYGMGWSSFTWDDGELVLAHSGQVENYVADWSSSRTVTSASCCSRMPTMSSAATRRSIRWPTMS